MDTQITHLSDDALDAVTGGKGGGQSLQGLAASTSAAGGLTAVDGMNRISDIVLGMANGAMTVVK